MTEVLDVSYDDDGEISQFLIFGDDGQPETKGGSAENLLLYDPENELPFDGGMSDFLSGNNALQLSDEVTVAQSGDEYSYILKIGESRVETTPEQAESFLQGVYDAVADDDTSRLERLHQNILKNQVRRRIVNVLAQTYDERHRISIVENGWLVDGFYLVDWNANMYTSNDDQDEGDYVREGTDAVKKDTSYEFVRLRHSLSQSDTQTVTIDGSEYRLSEREMLFLSKVKWLLHRRHYHPDTPFWDFASKWEDVPKEEPDLDVFDL